MFHISLPFLFKVLFSIYKMMDVKIEYESFAGYALVAMEH